MLSPRGKNIVEMILNHPAGITGRQLSLRLDVSQKTVRNDLVAVNEWLGKFGCAIHASKKSGYYIAGEQKERVLGLLKVQGQVEKDRLPQTPAERRYAVLDRVLGHPGIELAALAEALGVSEQTLYKDIAAIDRAVREYYGCPGLSSEEGHLYLRGTEYEIRRLVFGIVRKCIMSSSSMMDSCLYQLMRGIVNLDEINTFHEYGRKYCVEHRLAVPDEVLYISTWTIFYVNVRREEGKLLEKGGAAFEAQNELGKFLSYMNEALFLEMEDEDLALLYDLLDSLGFSGSSEPEAQVRDIFQEFLGVVGESYQISFDKNEQLKENLRYHLDCMIRRIRLDCQLDNPLKGEIRRRYRFAYEAAMVLANIVYSRLGIYPREDEISLMALYIQSCLQQGTEAVRAQMVCGSRMGYGHLVRQWLELNFSGRIKICGQCPQYLLREECGKNKAELVISMLPLKVDTGLPQMVLDRMVSDEDKERLEKLIRECMARRGFEYLFHQVFSASRILLFEDGASLEAMVRACSLRLNEEGWIKDGEGFFRAVMEREKVYPTLLSNGCYMPHPLENPAVRSCCCVGIAKKGEGKVQVVFVMALGRNVEKEFSQIYEAVQKVAESQEILLKLRSAGEAGEALELLYSHMKRLKYR